MFVFFGQDLDYRIDSGSEKRERKLFIQFFATIRLIYSTMKTKTDLNQFQAIGKIIPYIFFDTTGSHFLHQSTGGIRYYLILYPQQQNLFKRQILILKTTNKPNRN